MILSRLRSFFTKLIMSERCPKKLATSFCLGVYIAFSPFIGLHTAMTFLFGWLFALNTAIILTISMLINNPWTMVPVYGLDHVFGVWVFDVCGFDCMAWNPYWLTSCNAYLQYYTGISGLSLYAFMLGGNLLGVTLGVMLYPLIRRFFGFYVSTPCCSPVCDVSKTR